MAEDNTCRKSEGCGSKICGSSKGKVGQYDSKGKKTFTHYRFEQRKTGGGPPPTEISQATAKIIDAMKDTASFSGIPGGIDTAVDHSGKARYIYLQCLSN